MKKIALNFICKNESHVIERMISSVLPIVDLIVAVDTGSTDNTKNRILEIGRQNNVPAYVFDRTFDNFSNSRNYALEKLHTVVQDLKWEKDYVWGFFIDCDEVMHIDMGFTKRSLTRDLYVTTIQGEGMSFMRQLFFHLSKNFHWEGPIHETLQWDDPGTTTGMAEGISVTCMPDGASWKGNLEQKFLNYARLLLAYVNEGHDAFRWLFYIGDSYGAAASHTRDKIRKHEYEAIALNYYKRALYAEPPTIDEHIEVNKRISEKLALNPDTDNSSKGILLQAYNLDPRRAESMAAMITQYISERRWDLAYIYSSFAIRSYHNNNPFGQGVAQTEDSLYAWKLMLYHIVCCHHTCRLEEEKVYRNEFINVKKMNEAYFHQRDLVYIQYNSPLFLLARQMNPFKKRKFAI